MDENELSDFDITGMDEPTTETTETISTRILKHQERELTKVAMKRELASEIITELPPPGMAYHIVSNGSFDYWTFVPIIIDLLGGHSNEGWFSTWTLNRLNCAELFDLYDRRKLLSINFLTGTYFKRRETAVYAKLITGCQERGQRYKALENHAKISRLTFGDDYIVMEGSANFTANPRIEQNTITNSKALYEFHREWINEILSKP